MSISLGLLQLTNGANSFQATQGGILGFVIGNVSGLSVTVKLDGTGFSKDLYPGTVDFFPVGSGFTGTILLQATGDLHNVSSFAGNYVRVTAIGLREPFNAGAYPMQIPVQAISPSGSGQVNYSVAVNTSGGTSHQRLNLFNPLTSGVNFEVFSAGASSDDNAGPFATLSFTTGVDYNFATPETPVSHIIGGGNTSLAHVTYQDSNAAFTGQTAIQAVTLQTSVLQDFIAFPDKMTVEPGNNLTISIDHASPTHGITEVFKWTEVLLP